MSNVRTKHIKILSEKLIEADPDKFSTDFEKNKDILGETMTFDSSMSRNKVAGYISHSMVKMKKIHSLKVTYQNPNLDKRKKAKKEDY